MFAELESIDRTTKQGRKAYNALSRKIRRARGSRMFSGLKGLLSRKYPVPAGATGAGSTMGVVGTPAIPMPSLGTTAQTQPQPQIPIEEILVSASKRKMPEAKPQFDVSSKLGRNQLRSLQKRARRMKETPDAYERNPDYAIEFLPDYLRNEYGDELMQLAGRYNEGRMIGKGGMLFDPTDPTDVALMGLGMAPIPGARIAAGAGKAAKIAKNVKKADEMPDMKGLAGLIGAMMTAVMGGQYFGDKKKAENLRKFMEGNERDAERSRQRQESDQRLEKFFEAQEKDPDAFSKDSMDNLYFIDENGNPISDEEYYSIQRKAGGRQLMGQAQQLANAGRGEDTMLMHVTPDEVAGIASLAPGLMTTNPQTGLPEAGLFKDILGFGLPFLVGMIPGIGPLASAAISGAGRTALEGGDFKDLLGNVAMSGLSNKVMGNIMDTGATNLANEAATTALSSPEGFADLVGQTGYGMDAIGDIATSSGIDPTAFQGAINQGMNPSSYLSTVANPTQIGSFQQGLSDIAMSKAPPTFAGNIKNVGAAGFGGIQDALISKAGLPLIAAEGLKAQNTAQNRYQDMLANMEREREEREAENYRMNPENIPYYAREGGSLYKKRYIDGDYS